MKLLKKKLSVFFLVTGISIVFLLTGCGGGSINGNTGIEDPPASECDDGTDCNREGSPIDVCDDFSGTWEITEQIYSSFCPLPVNMRNMSYPVTQDGCELTIHTFGGIFTKTINNNSISLTGSYPDIGGMMTGAYTLLFNGDNLEGSSTWTWTDGVLVCTGTSQLTGSRSDFTIGPGCEDVSGSWHTSESFESQSCGVSGSSNIIYPVTQDGCDIKVNTTVGLFEGTVTDNVITYSGSFPDSGGTTNTLVELTIINNELTGSASWTWTGSTTCSGTTQVTGNRQ